MIRERAFPPIVDANTRLLILGSLPGRQSLDARQYYANPGNGFWTLVGAVINVDLRKLPYAARLKALLAHHIGLWDTIAEAARQGSLDSAIRDPQPRDLAAMAATLPALTTIAFNGVKAAKIGLKQLGASAERYETLTLLSSSGACAVRAEVKRADWLRLRDYLR